MVIGHTALTKDLRFWTQLRAKLIVAADAGLPGCALLLLRQAHTFFDMRSRSRIDESCEIEQELGTLNFTENLNNRIFGPFTLVAPDNAVFENQIFTA
jgi:hypothetical protein